MNDSKPLVSVLVVACKQGQHVRQAVESILIQDVNFEYEVVITESDASDDSKTVIREYKERHPETFRLLSPDQDWSAAKHYYHGLSNCRGEYIALLEGDDYWTDPAKLQTQIDFLQSNPAYSEAFTLSSIIMNESGLPAQNALVNRQKDVNNFRELNEDQFISVGSIVMRNFFKTEDWSWCFEKISGIHNRIIHAIALKHGKIKCIEKYMVVHRYIHEDLSSLSTTELVVKAKERVLVNVVLGELVDALNSDSIKLQLDEDMRQIKDYLNKTQNECTCVACGKEFGAFDLNKKDLSSEMAFLNKYNIIGTNKIVFTCPYCGSTDRERHILLYLVAFDFMEMITERTKVLHLAPEKSVSNSIARLNPIYVKGDLHPENFSDSDIVRIDVTDIPYKDEYFDVILCNYVLEKIPDDSTAMRELYRVLNSEGMAVIQTSYAKDLDATIEDPMIESAEERLLHYGDADYVRLYAENDFFERLASVGFQIKRIESASYFTAEMARRFAINQDEDLVLCLKSEG